MVGISAARLVALGLVAAALCGCGGATYEERLAKTEQRNRYLTKQDATLDRYWNQQLWGIWLRPPKGMVEVPAPPRAPEGEDPPPDLRMEFQGVPLDLPGVIQVWDGTLPTAGGQTGTYRLYVLGNHSRYTRQNAEAESVDPKTYLFDLETVLQGLYQLELPNGDTGRGDKNNERYRQSIPAVEEFAVQKPFVAVTFVPLQEGLQPFNAWLYEHTTGSIQMAVLMLVPPNASNEVRQTLLSSLETLQVSSQTPGRAMTTPGAGGTSTF